MILCLNELIDLFSWKFSESVNHISYSTQKGAQNREVGNSKSSDGDPLVSRNHISGGLDSILFS